MGGPRAADVWEELLRLSGASVQACQRGWVALGPLTVGLPGCASAAKACAMLHRAEAAQLEELLPATATCSAVSSQTGKPRLICLLA